ncbi:CMRF35-like molecule 8 [Rhincodon typus]|uniref:CMRF35-like molecule 8 n=1 Tax=Rhincodon typus TaxID=259920 RepID=UPI00202FF671|nr:CMRF35-like molecule 8 [Rhincodon typus]
MWTVILLICSIPVSGALWAEKYVTGILGRAITIHCHYEARWYQSHTKYWCQGWTRQCNVIATTNRANGRISITDNKTQGIFLVSMKKLQWGDAGWYSCGIDKPGIDPDPMFNVKLHISEEAVSVPGLQFLSRPNVSCSGDSVTISCESARGSLPIHYTWSEKTPSQDSKISDTNKLDLHCQSFTQQHHQYYCTASNTQGTKSSEIVHVSVNNETEKNCWYIIHISSIGQRCICDISSTIPPTTTHSQNTNTISSLSQKQTSEDEASERYDILCFDSLCEMNNIV